MGITLTNLRNVKDFSNKCMAIVEQETTRTLTRLGEEAIIIARDRPMTESWIDHTGNLRSSVGYAVYNNGEQEFKNGFQNTSAPEGNGAEGMKEGQEFLAGVAEGLSGNSKALVVVAGMNYADFVEAIDGKDVLATAELETRKKLPTYLAKTRIRIEEIIKRIL